MEDAWIQEVRREREAYAARFEYDIDKMADDLRKREQASGREYVNLTAKPIPATTPLPANPKPS